MMIICGPVEKMMKDNYVMETRKIAQILKKHHFQTSHKYQLVFFIHYFKTTKEKYLHVAIINKDNVDWVILMILKSHQVSCPSNIVHFVCGFRHSLFLDSEGNVFSVGSNEYGQLGLGHNRKQNELNKIPNIPPIKIISCVYASCYLIDFEGNLWTFGYNGCGQLGHGDRTHINTPKIINTLKDIQQISYGSCGEHFFAKNSQNQIFVTGRNDYEQLGTRDLLSFSIPKEMDAQYSNIWRDEIYTRAKSARK